MSFDVSRLRRADRIIGIGGIALFIFLFFFKWYGYSSNAPSIAGVNISSDYSIDGWHAFTVNRWIWLITIIAALGAVAISAGLLQFKSPVQPGVLVAGLGALSTLTILYRIVHHPTASASFGSFHASVGIKIGIWLGLIAAVAVTYGGYLAMRDEGTSLSDVREQASGALEWSECRRRRRGLLGPDCLLEPDGGHARRSQRGGRASDSAPGRRAIARAAGRDHGLSAPVTDVTTARAPESPTPHRAGAAIGTRGRAGAGRRRALRRMRVTVIARDEVLHVARLARLALAEDEIEPMARELSAVLDHVARIGELDLDDVAPTSHVVGDAMPTHLALRPDEPRPCLPREVALAQAPAVSDNGFLRSEPAGMSATDVLELSAAQAADAIAAGSLSAGELFEAYRSRAAADRAAGADGLNCFTWVAEDTPAPAPAGAALAGVPLAVKDLFCTEGVPSQSGSRILEGYLPPYTATVVGRLQDAGASLLGKTNQDEFAMGSSNENSAFGAVRNPWDRARVPGGSSGGSAAAVAAGLAPWALGTDTGGSIRQPAALCGIVGMKPTYGAVSRYGMIAFASSLDQAGPLTRDVRDAALLLQPHGRPRPVRRDLAAASRTRSRSPTAERLRRRSAWACPRSSTGEGIEAGRARGLRRDARARATSWARRCDDVRLPHAPHALSAYYLIAPAEASSNLARFDGVRYGLRADGRRATCSTCTRARATTASAPRSSAASCSAPTRCPPATTTPTTAAPRACARKIAEDFAAAFEQLRLDRHADRAHGRVRARREDRRPAGDVPERLLHGADVARRHPRDLDPVRPQPSGLPVGLQIAGPAFSENRAARRRLRARAGDRLRRSASPCLSDCERRSRRQAAP